MRVSSFTFLPTFLSEALALFRKDLRAELRTKVAVSSIGLFTLCALMLIALSTSTLKDTISKYPAAKELPAWSYDSRFGMLWVLLCFAAFAGMAHSFVHEEETGTTTALRLSMSPEGVYTGKLLYNFTLILSIAAVITPLYMLAIELPIGEPIAFVTTMLSGCVGLAATATFVAALAAKSRGTGALFGALGLPMLLVFLVLLLNAAQTIYIIDVPGSPRAQSHRRAAQLRDFTDYAIGAYVSLYLGRLTMATFPTQPNHTQPKASGAAQAGSAEGTRTALGLQGAWWKYTTGALMAVIIYCAFFVVKGAQGFGGVGDNSRIVFFHVPVAILSFITYVVATVYAVHVLQKPGDFEADGKSAAAMEIGFLFCILTTITGSIFSRAVWGQFWNWDPSQTRIVIMLMLFASYLVLRSANAEHPERRARLSAVYTILTLVPAFFLIWIVPRVLASFHPGAVIARPQNNSMDYNIVLWLSFLAFNMLFVWMFQLRCRIHRLAVRRQLAQL